MSTEPHTETVGTITFAVDGYSREWAEWSFAVKERWLENHTRPRASYAQACRILSAHAKARRAAAKAHQARRRATRAAAPEADSGEF